MASTSNSGDDENYWPGYVDALTTMTMVLTFVMMVLGVMVFILSQDQVSSKLGTLARALKIEARQLEKLNEAELQEAVRRAAADKDSAAPGSLTSGPKTGFGGDGPGGRLARAGGPGNGAPTGSGGLGGGQGLDVDAAGDTKSPFQSSFKGGLAGEKSGGPGGEYLVTNQGGVAGNEMGTGGRLETGPGALRFVFERGAIDLPPAVAEALEAYIASEGLGPLLVEAMAVPGDGGPSEARRKAYFRAMLIRSRLIKLGVDPTRIAVRVRDATQVSTIESVDVMKRSAGG